MNAHHDGYCSGSGLLIQSVGSPLAGSTRYGGMVASTDELRSRQDQAMSVRFCTRPHQFGGAHSAGQPDHGDGVNVDRGHGPPAPPSARTRPWGSPGTAADGPTVTGGLVTGSFSLGVTSSHRNAARVSTISPDAVHDSTRARKVNTD